jgi:hypothetical protein
MPVLRPQFLNVIPRPAAWVQRGMRVTKYRLVVEQWVHSFR